jgi:hypothetical protein
MQETYSELNIKTDIKKNFMFFSVGYFTTFSVSTI